MVVSGFVSGRAFLTVPIIFQVIVIDFGWAISLVSSDGTPNVPRERNDIIAGKYWSLIGL